MDKTFRSEELTMQLIEEEHPRQRETSKYLKVLEKHREVRAWGREKGEQRKRGDWSRVGIRAQGAFTQEKIESLERVSNTDMT